MAARGIQTSYGIDNRLADGAFAFRIYISRGCIKVQDTGLQCHVYGAQRFPPIYGSPKTGKAGRAKGDACGIKALRHEVRR